MKKNIIVITGGAGFVGTNLIKYFVKNTKFKIISIDDYSSGSKSNHIKSNRVIYINGKTNNIDNLLKKNISKIHTIFHFGEFSRIYQSFQKFNECFHSNTLGSLELFKFCLKHKIKLIYSATSASLGSTRNKKNSSLSPYAFSKEKNLELLENLKKWFNFKFEIIYFYNVYGPHQITRGLMSTVIGIFENEYINNRPLPVVRPGNQTRRFTHIDDTVKICIEAWRKNKCRHYSIYSTKNHSILDVAKMFKSKIIYLPKREGERFASVLTKMNFNTKVYRRKGKIRLRDYIQKFLDKNNKEN